MPFKIMWPSMQFILLVYLCLFSYIFSLFLSPACSHTTTQDLRLSPMCHYIICPTCFVSPFSIFLSMSKPHIPCSISFFIIIQLSFFSGFNTDRRWKSSHKIQRSIQILFWFCWFCLFHGSILGKSCLIQMHRFGKVEVEGEVEIHLIWSIWLKDENKCPEDLSDLPWISRLITDGVDS